MDHETFFQIINLTYIFQVKSKKKLVSALPRQKQCVNTYFFQNVTNVIFSLTFL